MQLELTNDEATLMRALLEVAQVKGTRQASMIVSVRDKLDKAGVVWPPVKRVEQPPSVTLPGGSPA